VRIQAAAVALVAALTLAAGAQGYPTGNLILNPGAEEGPASADGSTIFVPPYWIPKDAYSRVTSVAYGAPGFLTADQGAAYGGGRSFFAGGPPEADPNIFPNESGIYQIIDFPNSVVAEFAGGRVQATLSGCLGGYGDQNDYAELEANFTGGTGIHFVRVTGPSGTERGGRTGLLPRSGTTVVPQGTSDILVYLTSVRTSGPQTYYDGYADNLSLILSPVGSVPPQPSCTVSGPGAPAASGGPGAPVGPGPAPAVTTFLIARGSSKATLRSGRVGVSLTCTSHDAPCKGSLRVTVPSLPASASSVTLGSRSFTIAATKTATVSVSLRRRAKTRLAHMSARQLRRLKATATVTMGAASGRFALRLHRG